MNSKQRLLAVLNGQVPDRVPISTYEINGWNAASFENTHPSYQQLMAFIRENTDTLYMTSVPVPNLREADIQTTQEKWDQGDQHFTRTTMQFGGRSITGVQSHNDTVMTVWSREHTCKNLDDLETYLSLPWEPGDADFSALGRAQAELADTHGIPMLDMGDPICEVAGLFDLEETVVLAVTETAAIVRALDILHERNVERLRRVLRGPVQDCAFRICGPEYVTPPLMPPTLFSKLVTPYNKVYCDMMRQAGVFPRIHSHGKIGHVLDEIVKINPAALDPVEPPPDGDITIAQIKQRTGNSMCLMGGVELKHLEVASGDFVEQLIRDLMAQGKPGGRFVIMPTAAPINIPLSPKTEENYMRFIETALDCGKY